MRSEVRRADGPEIESAAAAPKNAGLAGEMALLTNRSPQFRLKMMGVNDSVISAD